MSAVVEETEPESSFKETDKHWKNKRNQEAARQQQLTSGVPKMVPEEESFESNMEDRDDDISDDDEEPTT